MDRSPAEGQPAAVQAAFAQLQARFVAGLPQRWQAIEAAASGPAQAAELHRLAGAAASYGHAALGEAARRAERLAEAADPLALQAALNELKNRIDAIVTLR